MVLKRKRSFGAFASPPTPPHTTLSPSSSSSSSSTLPIQVPFAAHTIHWATGATHTPPTRATDEGDAWASGRTRKRWRDARPDEGRVHQNTIAKLFAAAATPTYSYTHTQALPLTPPASSPGAGEDDEQEMDMDMEIECPQQPMGAQHAQERGQKTLYSFFSVVAPARPIGEAAERKGYCEFAVRPIQGLVAGEEMMMMDVDVDVDMAGADVDVDLQAEVEAPRQREWGRQAAMLEFARR